MHRYISCVGEMCCVKELFYCIVISESGISSILNCIVGISEFSEKHRVIYKSVLFVHVRSLHTFFTRQPVTLRE